LMNQQASPARRARFVIDDSSLNELRVSGFFRADNTETFVRLLEASFGVETERSGDVIILRKTR
jgi:ferric-dicitrate binding protein FerR (iron transport regulator)